MHTKKKLVNNKSTDRSLCCKDLKKRKKTMFCFWEDPMTDAGVYC